MSFCKCYVLSNSITFFKYLRNQKFENMIYHAPCFFGPSYLRTNIPQKNIPMHLFHFQIKSLHLRKASLFMLRGGCIDVSGNHAVKVIQYKIDEQRTLGIFSSNSVIHFFKYIKYELGMRAF
jgi:hypothetical protein